MANVKAAKAEFTYISANIKQAKVNSNMDARLPILIRAAKNIKAYKPLYR